MLDGGSVLVFLEKPGESETVTLHPRYAMYLAVESGLPLKGGRFSRPPPSEPSQSGKDVQLRNGSGVRYLAPAPDPEDRTNRLPQVSDPAACVQWEILLVCRAMDDGVLP